MLRLMVGVDVGNHATKVYPLMDDPFAFPTYIDTVASANMWESQVPPMEHLDFEVLESKADVPRKAFYGYLAASTRNGKPMPVRSNKARSPQVMGSLLCALAICAARQLEGMKAKERRALIAELKGEPLPVSIALGTGLPMDTWLNDDDRKSFRKAIKGNHRVRFASTPGWSEFGELELRIEDVIVQAEGTAILYSQVLTEDGKGVADANLAKGVALINDFGANTHDAPVYRQMKQDNILSRSYESKVAEQLDAMLDQIRKELGRTITRQNLVEGLFESDMKLPNGAREPISIRHLAEPRFKDLADLYASRTIECLESSAYRLTDVIMAGGAAAMVKPYFDEALRSRGLTDIPFRLHWPAKANFGNASGYLRWLMDALNRKAAG